MNDIEQELRELFEEKARGARIAPMPSTAVLKRGRRRQIGTAAIGAVTALLVAVASVAVLRTVGSGSATTPAAPNDLDERTATIQNFTLTAPEGWTMIDWWPFSRYLWVAEPGQATSAGSTVVPSPSAATTANVPSGTTTNTTGAIPADMVPVLQVSTFDPGLDATLRCGSGGAFGASDALLYVAVDAAAIRAGDPLPPPWPVPLQESDTAAGDPCGPGSYARFSLGGAPYFAFVRFGADVSGDVHQRMLDVFDGMQPKDAASPTPAGMAPGYVVAAGSVDGDAWRLELGTFPPTPFTNGAAPSLTTTSFVWASVITGSEDFRGRVPLSATPLPANAAGVGGAWMIPAGSQGLAVGSVLPDAASVRFVAPDGTESDANVLSVPDGLLRATTTQAHPGPDRIFWSLGDPQGGQIVQLAADGTELLRQRIIVVGMTSGGSSSGSSATGSTNAAGT